MKISDKCFNLKQICDSGQCFRMKQICESKFEIIAGDRLLIAIQDGEEAELLCSDEEYEGFWRHYFDLDRDYQSYIDAIDPEDTYLTKAAEFGHGIRILNQDLWEMVVTFLISQQNNIKRIHRCVNMICEKYGSKCCDDFGKIYYGFPRPEAFLGLEPDALMECNLGYRSKYVVETAGRVASGEVDLDAIAALDYGEARTELMKLYGVGKKVADCIALFALHKLEAFPVDTHINQVLGAEYPEGFPFEKYKGFEGVIQQYIFYYDLMN